MSANCGCIGSKCAVREHCAQFSLRDLFDACRSGELSKIKQFVNPQNINACDLNGRKSTPLHFAAGKFIIRKNLNCRFEKFEIPYFVNQHIFKN